MTSAFQQYQSGQLDGNDLKTADKAPMPTDYQIKAKILVANDFNSTFFPGVENMKTTADEFYVVWFAKVLGNWKALISTDLISGQYWEVTYDGNKQQTYVDHYVKRSNEAITDEAYAALS